MQKVKNVTKYASLERKERKVTVNDSRVARIICQDCMDNEFCTKPCTAWRRTAKFMEQSMGEQGKVLSQRLVRPGKRGRLVFLTVVVGFKPGKS